MKASGGLRIGVFATGVWLISALCHADHSMPLHYVQRQDDPLPPMVYFSKNFELGLTVYRSQDSLKSGQNDEEKPTVDIYLYLYDLNSDIHYQGTVYFNIQSPTGQIQKLVRTYTDERFLYILQLRLHAKQTYNLSVSLEDDKSIAFQVPIDVPSFSEDSSSNANSTMISPIVIMAVISMLPLGLFIAALISRRLIQTKC